MTFFSQAFEALTGTSPFPWQEALYGRFASGELPSAADVPTGLGKTSVVAIWLVALLQQPGKTARRLVYVVNRRTVVDQTTAEVERIRERLQQNAELLGRLQKLCAIPTDVPLALSTLRGQFADNREWCTDPARPAVIVGTVDMIGSGLLFSRYTAGFKTRPHHAALLGQDALLIHDEAHLEPAFQALLESIGKEQRNCGEARPMHVLQLTATARGAQAPFVITPEDERHPTVRQRLKAPKQLRLTELSNEAAELVPKLTELALARRDSGRAVLVFARSVDAVQKVAAALTSAKLQHEVLTGTMRGKEREALIRKPVFARFLPPSSRPPEAEAPAEGTCYLVATSAGEVGVNISADDLICDLSTYDSMAQRFGRVNRFGALQGEAASVIELLHPAAFKNADPGESKFDSLEAARSRTLDLLRQLSGDASPDALRQLKRAAGDATILGAFSPPPDILPATDILFDSWAMTSIRGSLPGRPPVAPYLHGAAEWQPPETHVAWRKEVEIITDQLAGTYPPEELLSEFPLKPHELLRDRSSRVRRELEQMAKRLGRDKASETLLWLIAGDGTITFADLASLADKDLEDLLEDVTVLLPPSLGGLSDSGLLEGKSPPPLQADTLDVAATESRQRVRSDALDALPAGFRLKVLIDTRINDEEPPEPEGDESEAEEGRYWLWMEKPAATASDCTRSRESVTLDQHTCDVVAHARNIAAKLALSASTSRCVVLAAALHDLGKCRCYWQQGIGNFDKTLCLAKAGPKLRPRPGAEPYRHEFGSLLDVNVPERLQKQEACIRAEFAGLSEDEKDIVLHLVAAHHGRARPHFPADECFDPEAAYEDAMVLAAAVPLRFARLQRRFGRWGLAWLESLLRAADYAASAEIEPLNANSHD